MINKKKLKKIVPILMCAALLLTGIFAFLTAHDNKVNKFSIGDIDVAVGEPDWIDEFGIEHPGWYDDIEGPNNSYEVLHDENENGVPDFAELIKPGQVIDKAPFAENTGSINQWVFLMVGIPTGEANADGLVEIQNTETDRTKHIMVRAHAVQTGYVDGEENPETVWAQLTQNENVYSAAAENTENRVELFPISGFEGLNVGEEATNFTFIPYSDEKDCFEAANGFNYYVYGYNSIIAPEETTTRLFTSVTLTNDLLMHIDHTPANVRFIINGDGLNPYTYQVNENCELNETTITNLLVTRGWDRDSIESVEYLGTAESSSVWVSSTVGGTTYEFTATISQ